MILAQTDVVEPWQVQVADMVINGIITLAVIGLFAWGAYLFWRD